jgi:predicted flavoprotein YhiN
MLLTGVSVAQAVVTLQVGAQTFHEQGGLVFTHWGMSGPAIIKLSAWAARALAARKYKGELRINWAGDVAKVVQALTAEQRQNGRKHVTTRPEAFAHAIPRNLWTHLVHKALPAAVTAEADGLPWRALSKQDLASLQAVVCADPYSVEGKGVFKEEFVTAGGVPLSEIDLASFQSRRIPGLFFAGELLDVVGAQFLFFSLSFGRTVLFQLIWSVLPMYRMG